MKFYSLNRQSPQVDFKIATIKGQAPDKGLYFPEYIPVFRPDFIKNIDNYSKEEIAFHALEPFVGDSIPTTVLEKIISETIDFSFPLLPVSNQIYSLELFHGPTLAFKDVGARFMSRCLGYFVKDNNKHITVLVATSGDTGGAVANGFYNVDGVNVVILYPSGKVSDVQELQLTTLGHNITAIEVDGNFDDCQNMVKEAFADETLNDRLFLTSANSINVARWLPQQFYYLFAYQQWGDKQNPPVISVPSGNFGNICAGLVSYLQGMPVKHFIAAVNVNDSVAKYFAKGVYKSQQAVATISNAMDVGNPSNFIRILELFKHNYPAIKKMISCYSINDDLTESTIQSVYNEYNYLLDPHGAVGYAALQEYQKLHTTESGLFLETAHPIKFLDVVESVIHKKVSIPETIQSLLEKKKSSIKMNNSYPHLKTYLLDTLL